MLRARGVDTGTAATSSGEGALDTLGRARAALEKGDVPGAVDWLGELAATQPGADGSEPVLARGARWLAAALASVQTPTRRRAVELLDELVKVGDDLAPRALAARAVELGEAETALRATTSGGAFSPADRVVLSALLGFKNDRADHDVEALVMDDASRTLVAATAQKSDDVAVWSGQTAGDGASRAAVRVGRLLAAGTADIDSAADAAEPVSGAFARALRIESARRGERYDEVVAALASQAGASHALAAALVAERARLQARAAAAYRDAYDAEPTNEAAARAAAELDDSSHLPDALRGISDVTQDPIRGALLKLEALLRSPLEPKAELDALEVIHKLAPQIPFATFLAQRVARRAGDEAAVVHWLRERQKATTDPLERALDVVREALLVAENDAARRERAPRRGAPRAPRGRRPPRALRATRERAARRSRRVARAARRRPRPARRADLLFIEAAYEHERTGDAAGGARRREGRRRRTAKVRGSRASLSSAPSSSPATPRASPTSSSRTRATRPPSTSAAKPTSASPISTPPRETIPASALLWHRSILEESPDYSRASATSSTRSSASGATTSSSRSSRRSRARSTARAASAALTRSSPRASACAPGDWEGDARVRRSSARSSPSPRCGRCAFATRTRAPRRRRRAPRVDARAPRAHDAPHRESRRSPCARAEAALRSWATRERAESARDRAPPRPTRRRRRVEAPRRASARSAATRAARPKRTRASRAPRRPTSTTSPPGTTPALLRRTAEDDGRAIAALEQAAAIDVTLRGHLPAPLEALRAEGRARRARALLERRIATVLDPEERVALEVDRGRALAEVGDFGAAKDAYDAALAVQPDHVGALRRWAISAATQKDWEGAEQVWVRLARLLATPEEQLDAYRRLGDLYAEHLTNLPRAEVALREVLKRAPDDVLARERLVDVYKQQNDAARALEIQNELLTQREEPRRRSASASSSSRRSTRTASHDLRKAEQTLEAARREFPSDVGILRALAEFYVRHKQTPAVNILLDRAAGRRAPRASRTAASRRRSSR